MLLILNREKCGNHDIRNQEIRKSTFTDGYYKDIYTLQITIGKGYLCFPVAKLLMTEDSIGKRKNKLLFSISKSTVVNLSTVVYLL